jgi:hypothetical protein
MDIVLFGFVSRTLASIQSISLSLPMVSPNNAFSSCIILASISSGSGYSLDLLSTFQNSIYEIS